MKYIITILLFLTCIKDVDAQITKCIPENKYEYYKQSFIYDCKSTNVSMPFSIKMNEYNWSEDMKYEIFTSYTAKCFILECDTILLYYMTRPIYNYYMDADSLVLVQGSYRTTFNFKAVGCFDYKNYMIVVYSYPLADPNNHKSYTINVYTKDGELIDRMPFFIWRADNELFEADVEEFDAEWLELSGYIDKNFEITICKRTQWEILHEDNGVRKEGMDEDTYNSLHEYAEYHVYNISDEGHFVEVQKPHKYEVDEKNNWTPIK